MIFTPINRGTDALKSVSVVSIVPVLLVTVISGGEPVPLTVPETVIELPEVDELLAGDVILIMGITLSI